jgi:hypothetical protein
MGFAEGGRWYSPLIQGTWESSEADRFGPCRKSIPPILPLVLCQPVTDKQTGAGKRQAGRATQRSYTMLLLAKLFFVVQLFFTPNPSNNSHPAPPSHNLHQTIKPYDVQSDSDMH